MRNKLISIRLDRVINCLLQAMLCCCEDNGLFVTLNCYDPVSDGLRIYVRADKNRPIV